MFSRPLLSSLLALSLATLPMPVLAAEPPADEEGGEEAPAEEGTEDAGTDEEASPEEADAEGEEGAEEGDPAESEDGAEEPAEAEAEEPAEEATEEGAEEETEDAAATEEVGPPEDPRGPEPRIADKPAKGKGLLIAGGAVTGVGAAFIATSFLITRCEYGSALDCRYGNQDTFLIPAAITVTSVGVLLLAGGAVNAIRYKKWENGELNKPKQRRGKKAKATAMFGPTYLPSGAGLGAVGRF